MKHMVSFAAVTSRMNHKNSRTITLYREITAITNLTNPKIEKGNEISLEMLN